ncbi:MAG: succinate-semialdehyde dehydrogenase (NADP+) [Rhodobacteraceae bacterium]|nr:MAG: succinate-semialdehyde dehydrogenase (NADP+) [Paracoccaceae bacterium]
MTRVLFDGDLVVGVELADGSKLHAAGKLILAASHVGAAKLLLLSGVGPADELRALGLPVMLDQPHVGRNLENHPGVKLQYAAKREDMVRAVWLARDLFAQRTRDGIRGAGVNPTADLQTDDDILPWVKRSASTSYHPSGATRMAVRAQDGLVDAQGRVHGLRGLRVVGPGIMPRITTCNLSAPPTWSPKKSPPIFAATGPPEGIQITLPLIPKQVSLTGSTPVGKLLQRLAPETMKRCTMELGGHAPGLMFANADIPNAVERLVAAKFSNAGQVCTSPTRFFVHRDIFEDFLAAFVNRTKQITVGDGAKGKQMGPMITERRRQAIATLAQDAVAKAADLRLGGHALPGKGYFYAPTVLANVPDSARLLTEDPFGPIAAFVPFDSFDEVIARTNALPYGLAAYIFRKTSAPSRVRQVRWMQALSAPTTPRCMRLKRLSEASTNPVTARNAGLRAWTPICAQKCCLKNSCEVIYEN